MHFIIVGLNHKTASVDTRELTYFPVENIADAYNKLNHYNSIRGSVILSTCNRVELYATVEDVEQGYKDIEDFICNYHHIKPEELHESIYHKRCEYAVTHLFKVASSLDSMVIGEYQIQGQVRDAYFVAFEQKSTNGILNKLFQTAIQIGKKVRHETEIGKGKVSVATLAIDLIKQIYEDNNSFRTLLVGAGKMSNLTATNLKQLNSSISVTNRSIEKSHELAKVFDAEIVEYTDRYKAINNNDIIIVSTSASDYTITKEDYLKQNEAPKEMKIFLDLSIPRNIDPTINEIENCMLYSIDDINKLVNNNLSARHKEMDKAEKMIDEVAQEYYEWYAKQYVVPLMKDLKKDLDTLKHKTLHTFKSSMSKFDAEQQQIMNEMLDSYSDKLIKVIMTNLKNATTKEEIMTISKTLKKSFTIEIEEQ
jgi:glutamyl-tRNA reductase